MRFCPCQPSRSQLEGLVLEVLCWLPLQSHCCCMLLPRTTPPVAAKHNHTPSWSLAKLEPRTLHVDLPGNAASLGRWAEWLEQDPLSERSVECESSIPLPAIRPDAGLTTCRLRRRCAQTRLPFGPLAPAPALAVEVGARSHGSLEARRRGLATGLELLQATLDRFWTPLLQHRQCVRPCRPMLQARRARPGPQGRQAERQCPEFGAARAQHQQLGRPGCLVAFARPHRHAHARTQQLRPEQQCAADAERGEQHKTAPVAGNWTSRLRSFSKRPLAQDRMNSWWPIGTLRATNPRCAGGLSPRHTSSPSSPMPGGTGPPRAWYTRVLPRFAASPASRSMVAVTASNWPWARDGEVTT